MATNDRVTVDIQEIENELVTSPQEHNDYWETHWNTCLSDDPMMNEDLKKLYILTRRDDWNTAYRDIFKEDPIENSKYLTAKISVREDTALHIAIATQSFIFAEELIKCMKREDLTIKNSDGNTAFSLVVASKNVRLAKQMFEKNGELPNIHGANQMLPIQVAAQEGHKLMVEFLNKIQGSLEEMDNIKSSSIASENGSSEDRVENVASHSLTNQADDPKIMEIHGELSNVAMYNLSIAAMFNDWNTTYRDIFKRDPFKNSKYLTSKISLDGDTALHLATMANSIEFVKELIKYMLKEELVITNDDGNTAFLLAAEKGIMEIVNAMFEKNRWLPSICGYSDDLPIHRAAMQGQKLMVEFLYRIQGPLKEMDSNKLSDFWREDKQIIKKLYLAAINDDWETARKVYEEHPDYKKAQIPEQGGTVLHIAVAAKSSVFVQNWVNIMNPEDLAIKNHDGDTAFCLAAASGNLELAEKMFDKSRELRSIRGEKEMLPINMAVQSGHKEVFKFLYEDFLSISNDEDKYLNEEDNCKLIHSLIRTDIYDIPLNLLKEKLKEKPKVATWREESNGETALHILAQKRIFPNQKDSDSDKICHESHELIKLLWQQFRDLKLDEHEISDIIDHPRPLIFDAVEQRNIDFLAILIHEFPKLILKVNENKYSIFHVAVLHRRKEIFKLIDDVGLMFKKSILEKEDDDKNNILHLAAMMPPHEQLNNVLEVALQLQQEWSWFEEVKMIMDPKHVGAKNKDKKTPRDLFNKKMTDLKDKGEKWMKEIANSCMIVATLITTVAFAAAFTVPGGLKDDTGTPHFIQEVPFIIFVISDAIALASSSWSILTILSIYNTRYPDEDFVALPRKVVIGLSTLSLSIAAVMVVFCATIFIVFKEGKIWVPTLASIIASLPVISLTKQSLQLFYGVARLTFGKSFLSEKKKKK